MTNVYIKSCNRSAYLDRCIRSVKAHAQEAGEIIVLDDGTEEKYLDKISADHRDVEIRRSPHGSEKREFIKANYAEDNDLRRTVTDLGFDPCAFWVDEIKKDSGDHVLIMEEDAWFKGDLNLSRAVRNMAANNAVILKLWLNGKQGQEEGQERGADVDIRAVFDDGSAIDYYTPVIKEIMDVYQIFILAFSIYRRDYWLNSFDGVGHYLDEPFMLNHALEYVLKNQSEGSPVKFARTGAEIVHQSGATTCRTDSGGMGVDVKIDNRIYNQAMDEAWLAGKLDPMNNFPDELDDAYLADLFRDALGDEAAESWLAWRSSYDTMRGRIAEKTG